MSQFALLNSKRFLPLFSTLSLGALNDNIYKNALVIYITFTLAQKTSIDSTILVILAGGIFILPFFLFSALAGQLADKYEKSMLIQRIKVAEILIMSFAVIGFISQSVMVLMTVLFMMGTQSTFFGPLKYGILPQHLNVYELTGGNGLVQMGTFLAILGGTIIGGVLIALGEFGVYLVSVVVVLIAIAGWWSSRYIPIAEEAEKQLKIDWNIARQTFLILRYVYTQQTLIIAIVAISWFWFIGATYLSLVPTYTRDILHGDELVTTALLTAFSIGIGLGSLFCERLSRRQIEPGLVPIGALGLSLFALDLYIVGYPHDSLSLDVEILGIIEFMKHSVYWRVLFDLVCIGFSGGIYIVPLYAMVQNRSSLNHRARVIAATNIVNALFMVISAVLVIALIKLALTIPQIYLLIGVLNLCITGVIFIRFPEYLQRLLLIISGRREQSLE
jgi:MFS family permease